MPILPPILALLLALCGLTASAQELTVTALTSNANDGIALTFSQDVRVTHNVFGTKCYTEITDKDGTPSSLNATPITQANTVTLTAAYCTFVNGHRIHLDLNPECFTTLDGTQQLTGTTTFDFVMGDGAAAEPITAVQIAPANGTLTRLGNIAVVFNPAITEILDPTGVSVTNENGHSLPILSVTIDGETSIHALSVNVDPERATLQGGTTYSLHIAPGALKCGAITNDTELTYGRWYVKPEPLVLVTDPPHQRMVESISEIAVSAENGRKILCTDVNSPNLQLTGIMDDQSIVFATVTKIRVPNIGPIRLTLDRPISAKTLAEMGATYDFVKLAFPAGLFSQGSTVNDAFQTVWKIGTPKPVGDVAWNFTPRPGNTLACLGTPLTVETENGNSYDVYTLQFGITGQDAYMTITDAQNIKLVDTNTGRTVKAFDRTTLRQAGTNAFMLVMDAPITQNGRYSLVIPAASVNLYSDAEHYSAPQHPDANVTATWTVYNASAPFYGDANGDGIVSGADIAQTINALTHPDDSTAILKNIDLDNDGRVTLADLHLLIDMLLRRKEHW